MSSITSLLAAGLMASAAVAAPANIKSKRETSQPMVHSFEDVPHSADLTWVPCYDDKWCANLVVPLDYAKPEVGTTWIAFIKSEGANSTGQDVLYNPGGPNGSGVLSILAGLAEEFHGMTEGLYNFVSFDPRGVNASGIDPTCFPGDPETRTATFSKPNPEDPYELFYTSVAMGQYCSQAAKDTELKYVSTAAVVQDMMHFTELQAALDGHENPKESEIWYWGTSYGTIVAQTLAAMYPDRIGRVVSDANVNGEEWYNGMTKMAIKDTDKAFDYFFESCYNAGPEKCQFAGESKSAEEIKDRIYTIIEGLEKKPLISLDGGPGLITKKLVVSAIFQALYGPVGSFEIMDLAFVALEAGNATQVLQVLSARASRVRGPGPFNYDQIKQAETQMAVTRLDANGRFPYVSVEDYVKDIEEYKKASPLFGENFAAGNPLLAAGFSLSPPESQIFPGFTKDLKTKNPVLFINTNGDPVTPDESARHMSQYFSGSVVLLQNAGGHSFTAVPSKCSIGHFARYLEDATLPPADTVCETDIKPFQDTEAQKKVKRDVLSRMI